jgi:hypothetical protein
VSLHVLFAVYGGAEALVTERTLVRLHAHVRGRVPGEAAVGGERSITDAAAERLHSCSRENGTSLPNRHKHSNANRCTPQVRKTETASLLCSASFRSLIVSRTQKLTEHILFFFVLFLKTEFRALCFLGKHSTTLATTCVLSAFIL